MYAGASTPTSLPLEIRYENPRSRTCAPSMKPCMLAPLCDTRPMLPAAIGAPMWPAKPWKFFRTLTTPRHDGPHTAMPVRAMCWRSSSCNCRPSAVPVSAKPVATMIAAFTPISSHSRRAGMTLSRGTATMARSTGCGTSRTDLKHGLPMTEIPARIDQVNRPRVGRVGQAIEKIDRIEVPFGRADDDDRLRRQ